MPLGDRKQVTLEIDTSAIRANKKAAKRTYKNYRSYMPMFGHIAEIINACCGGDIRFAVRTGMDSSLKESISAIRNGDWKAVVNEHEPASATELVARTLHLMEHTPQVFCLVVQKKWVADESSDDPTGSTGPVQMKLDQAEDSLYQIDDESAVRGWYVYRAITTNLDGYRDEQIVWWYDQRSDTSENRLKKYRNDFNGAHLPCGDLNANAAYMQLCQIACNLLALMRMKLSVEWYRVRAISFHHRLYAVAGQVVRHARQWTLKVTGARLKVLNDALWRIRQCSLA